MHSAVLVPRYDVGGTHLAIFPFACQSYSAGRPSFLLAVPVKYAPINSYLSHETSCSPRPSSGPLLAPLSLSRISKCSATLDNGWARCLSEGGSTLGSGDGMAYAMQMRQSLFRWKLTPLGGGARSCACVMGSSVGFRAITLTSPSFRSEFVIIRRDASDSGDYSFRALFFRGYKLLRTRRPTVFTSPPQCISFY